MVCSTYCIVYALVRRYLGGKDSLPLCMQAAMQGADDLSCRALSVLERTLVYHMPVTLCLRWSWSELSATRKPSYTLLFLRCGPVRLSE